MPVERKPLYHPTVDDVITALKELNSLDYGYLHAYSKGDIGNKIHWTREPRCPLSWQRHISATVLERVIPEALASGHIAALNGRRAAVKLGLGKSGMLDRGTYYITSDDLAKARDATEARELKDFKSMLRQEAVHELLQRHKEELADLISAGMERYEELLSRNNGTPSFNANARAEVLDNTKHLFVRV